MMLATTLLIGSTKATDLTSCPVDTPDCKQSGEACGYENVDNTLALCSTDIGLVCQSAAVIPADEIGSKYTGTCVQACDSGYIEIGVGICAPVCSIEDDLEAEENWLWVGDQRYLTVDTCNNRCKCNALTGTFECPDAAPCKRTSPECKELSRSWADSQGNTCEWYEGDAMRCVAFGDRRPDADGVTANKACCVCGGGKEQIDDQWQTKMACPLAGSFVEEGLILYTDICGSSCECGAGESGFEWTCTRGEDCPDNCVDAKSEVGGVEEEWVDANGKGCAWYEEDQLRCLDDTLGAIDTMRAAQACCACGRMEIASPQEQSVTSNVIFISAAAAAGVFLIAFIVVLVCLCKTKSELDDFRALQEVL